MTHPSVVIGCNTSLYVWQRSNLVKAMLEKQYSVSVFAPRDEYSERLVEIGVNFVEVPMKMNKNPISDLLLYLKFRRKLRILKPNVFLGFTIKPNVYGTISALSLKIPVINNIAGLGATFIGRSLTTKLVKFLYRTALSRSSMVFFQNPDDRRLFINENISSLDGSDLIPGSGVDLSKFPYSAKNEMHNGCQFRFLLIGRLLWDKGVGEYIEAARIVKRKHPSAEFCILGEMDVDNPSAIPNDQVNKWLEEGVVKHLGYRENVAWEINKSMCVVLPSYREGLPRSLLEASAIGRPIIATDVPGCRETVEHGKNGYLCKLKNAEDLADKMCQVLELGEEGRVSMGIIGRKKVETDYDEQIVINKYIDTIERLI